MTTESEKMHTKELFEMYMNDFSLLPCSFTYDGIDYKGISSEFSEISRQEVREGEKRSFTIVFSHKTGLEITLILTVYENYSAIEHTLWFENRSEKKLPLLENILAANKVLSGKNPYVLHTNGDDAFYPQNANEFKTRICMGMNLTFYPYGGRPTNFQFPYYNFISDDWGCYIAIGWPGQWKSEFINDSGISGDLTENVTFKAGQASFSAKLEPKQRIRTPLISFLYYENPDEYRSVNLWRRWFIDCNMRKIDGKLFPPVKAGSTSWIYEETRLATEENQIQAIKKYEESGVHLDFWWMDAGWYYQHDNTSLTEGWWQTGEWRVDEKRFPKKIKGVSDYAHSIGTKTLLWFEPERVNLESDSFLANKPQWRYNGKELVDFSNKEFFDWLVNRVDTVISEGDIDLYRQDYNIDPLSFWLENDKEDGVGITENLYIQGYLAYWDELIRRHPDLMIDSCASGGRRNDLETMRRSVSLHKTDADYSNFDKKQAMHQTLFKWFPYFGTPVTATPTPEIDLYAVRSAFCPLLILCYDVRQDEDTFQEIIPEFQKYDKIKQFFYDDYYALTPWDSSSSSWTVWEFFNSEKQEGYVQLFRKENCEQESFQLILKGLDSEKDYVLENLDGGEIKISGKRILNEGIEIKIEKRTSIIFFIKVID